MRGEARLWAGMELSDQSMLVSWALTVRMYVHNSLQYSSHANYMVENGDFYGERQLLVDFYSNSADNCYSSREDL